MQGLSSCFSYLCLYCELIQCLPAMGAYRVLELEQCLPRGDVGELLDSP